MASLPLPTPCFIVSLSGKANNPGSLSLLSLTHPNPHSPLQSFNPYVSSSFHALSILPPNGPTRLEGLVASSEEGKNILHIHSLGVGSSSSKSNTSSGSVTRIIPPQRLTSTAFSPDGSLLCAGCDDGRAYLWEVSTGKLRASWEPHFRRVNVIRWDSKSEVIATGGDDGRVCLWSTVGLFHPAGASVSANGLGSTVSQQQPQPYATFTSHLLPITDLSFSPESGSFPAHLRLWSASKDGTVKLWDVRTRTLLTNFDFTATSTTSRSSKEATDATAATATVKSITSIAPDSTGRFCFVALELTNGAGRVHRLDLYQSTEGRTEETHQSNSYEAIGGGGLDRVESVSHYGANSSSSKRKYIDLKTVPTSMSLLPSTSHLLIGTAAPPMVHIVDVRSLQIVRSVGFDAPSSDVTNLISFYRPHDTLEAAGMSAGGASQKKWDKRIVASQLERAVSSSSRSLLGGSGIAGLAGLDSQGEDDDDDDVVWAVVPDGRNEDGLPDLATYLTPPSLIDSLSHSISQGATSLVARGGTASSSTSSNNNALLQEEINTLRDQLTQASRWNEEMWKVVVKTKLAEEEERFAALQRGDEEEEEAEDVTMEEEEVVEEESTGNGTGRGSQRLQGSNGTKTKKSAASKRKR